MAATIAKGIAARERQFVPGPVGLPLIGSVRDFNDDALAFCASAARNYGDVVRWRMVADDWHMLSNADDVVDVLIRRAHLFHKPRIARRIWHHFLGDGLLSIDGPTWKRHHKLMLPGFHKRRIDGYAEHMVRFTERMCSEWTDGQHVDMCEAMTELTLAIVAKALFDSDVRRDGPTVGRAMRVLNEMLSAHIHLPLPLPKWWPSRGNRAKHRAIRDVEKIVRDIISERRASGVDHGDLLSMLVFARDEGGRGLDDKELRDEAMTLFFAGHETTAHALTWMWYLLARHPEVEVKLHDELQQVAGSRPLRVDDLAALPYLEQVVKESMRLLPSVWCYMREPVEDVRIGDYLLPKGTHIFICPYVIHRDSRYYDEPEEFRPERFTKAMEAKLPKGAYVPFSMGPRVCMGKAFAMMEAKLVLGTMVRRLHCRLEPDYEPQLYPKLSLSPKNGLRAIIERRRPGRSDADPSALQGSPR